MIFFLTSNSFWLCKESWAVSKVYLLFIQPFLGTSNLDVSNLDCLEQQYTWSLCSTVKCISVYYIHFTSCAAWHNLLNVCTNSHNFRFLFLETRYAIIKTCIIGILHLCAYQCHSRVFVYVFMNQLFIDIFFSVLLENPFLFVQSLKRIFVVLFLGGKCFNKYGVLYIQVLLFCLLYWLFIWCLHTE